MTLGSVQLVKLNVGKKETGNCLFDHKTEREHFRMITTEKHFLFK